MHRISKITVIVAGLVFTLGGTSSWGQPPDPTLSDAQGNTAGGTNALFFNTTGGDNSAFGLNALKNNTVGNANTASGSNALRQNITGDDNTASGFNALRSNLYGHDNTASGVDALRFNVDGGFNTADGASALKNNTQGSANTAVGASALRQNTIGVNNTVIGADALKNNTEGSKNTATGVEALHLNVLGDNNTALGFDALFSTTTGDNNMALGAKAGSLLVNGDNNIYLGNPGAASESNTMRLGSEQIATFIAGVAGTPVTGSQVLISSNGQLGILASSARYKHDIRDMGGSSRKLLQLRPVTFRYNQDAQGVQQYGLIAEEVAKVYPELVVRREDGTVETVQYHELIPMLLNEHQHQHQQLVQQQQEITALKAQNKQLQAALLRQNAALAARVEQLEAVAHRATLASR